MLVDNFMRIIGVHAVKWSQQVFFDHTPAQSHADYNNPTEALNAITMMHCVFTYMWERPIVH